MDKVLTELKNKNEHYFNQLVCKCIVPFMITDVFCDFVNDGRCEIPFDYRGEIECYLEDQDCINWFSAYVDEMFEINPNIITDLQKIKSNYLYDEYYWNQIMDDCEGFVIHDCLSDSESLSE